MPVRSFQRLIVPASMLRAIIDQARSEAPLECCGILAGRTREGIATAEVRYALANEAASPTEFVSAARDMFAADRDMRRRGLELIAVYHSHPASHPVPSKTDLERNYSPSVVNIIVSLKTDPPEVKAWWLRNEGYTSAELTFE